MTRKYRSKNSISSSKRSNYSIIKIICIFDSQKNIYMTDIKDFKKYAADRYGISSLTMHQYISASNGYISPTIIEERQMNVASMDVFSRLMMDRIIFLGLPIDDYVANIIQAQLLYLDSSDPGKDIQIYLNTPGGSVSAGMGIYDTMQYITSDIA